MPVNQIFGWSKQYFIDISDTTTVYTSSESAPSSQGGRERSCREHLSLMPLQWISETVTLLLTEFTISLVKMSCSHISFSQCWHSFPVQTSFMQGPGKCGHKTIMTLFCFEVFLLLSNSKEAEKIGGISYKKVLAGFCYRLYLFRFLWIKDFFGTG